MTTNDNKKVQQTDNTSGDILRSIAAGQQRLSAISRYLKTDKGNLHRALKRLIKANMVKFDKFTKTYFLTPIGAEFVKNESTTKFSRPTPKDQKYLICSEKIEIVIGIKSKPKDWEYRRRQILLDKNLQFSTRNLKNHNIYVHTWEDMTISNDCNSIRVSLGKMYNRNGFEFWTNLMLSLSEKRSKIERFYDIELSDELRVISQEGVNLQDILANYPEKVTKGNYWIFYDPISGKPRWKLDKSRGFREFEYMSAEFSDTDFDRINHDLLYDFVKHDNAKNCSELTVGLEQLEGEISDLPSKLDDQKKIMYDIIKISKLIMDQNKETSNMYRSFTETFLPIHKEHAENIATHTAVLKGIQSSFSEFNELLHGNGVSVNRAGPLALLKEKIKCKGDILHYATEIKGLNESDRNNLSEWLLENDKR